MKILDTLFILSILTLSLLSCNSTSQEGANGQQQALEIPKLLDRHPALRQDKEWEKVQNYYVENRQKLERDPSNGEARLALAQLYINEARITGEHGHYYPAALEVLNGIELEKADDDVRFRALASKAGVQLSLHDFAAGLETAQQAVAINPYNAQIYGALVDANVELGRYEEAVAMADKMVGIRPDLRSYARVSYLREIYGQVEGAIEAMKLAVSAGYPSYEETAWARLTLGKLYENYGSLEEAERQYQIILAERPDYPFAIGALADIAIERKDYPEAERLLKQAAGIIPEFSFYESLASIYKKTGRQEDFERTMAELWVMLKDDTESGHNMDLEYAKLYSSLMYDQDKALEYAKKEYQKRPDNIDVNRVMATICQRRGDSAEAARYFQAATRTNSRHPGLEELRQQLASK
ncbi:MAG: tetratricopeptide repeat protein [Lewinellaceae bacterium]|nr:tetratricopeptide repeat protein [Phaeodactylibacter sp.]MCB9036746.1 tetratricopeptide repeat protein [Lewinellaceae bacterium]